ncbi:MAG: histidine kinase [Rhodocyclales bacterium]|nr:histidine kinase [Rhodocyclales bacterium]
MTTAPASTVPATRTHAITAGVIALGITALIAVVAYRPGAAVLWLVLPATLLAQGGAALACVALRRYRPDIGWPGWLACGITAAGLGALAGAGLGASLLGRELDQLVLNNALTRALLAGLLLGACIVIAWRLLADGRAREQRWLNNNAALEIKRLRLEGEIARAELQVMQTQIEPHFLFNTLANLRQLIRTDSEGALRMNEHLIRYFKALTASLSQPEIALRNELELCDAYMAIMEMRRGDEGDYRVIFDARAEREQDTLPLPPASLLTLIENAIKHGQPEHDDKPKIEVRIGTSPSGWSLSVTDNGPGLKQPPHAAARQGTGLTNLRARLALLYGDAAGLRLHDGSGGGCVATLHLPRHGTD